MSTKVLHLRELFSQACRLKSTSPLRSVPSVADDPWLTHQKHLKNLLRQNSKVVFSRDGRSSGGVREYQNQRTAKLDTGTSAKCSGSVYSSAKPMRVPRNLYRPGQFEHIPKLLYQRPSATCLQHYQHHNQGSMIRRNVRDYEQENAVRPKTASVKGRVRNDEAMRPKPHHFQVTHESQHYYLSARLEALQPSRMTGFTPSLNFSSFSR